MAVGLGWLVGQSPLETLHWDVRGLLVSPLLALPPLGLVWLCLWRPIGPLADLVRVVDQMLTPLFRQCTLAEMAIICLLAGLGEEMLFRGVIQAGIANWASDGPATTFLGERRRTGSPWRWWPCSSE